VGAGSNLAALGLLFSGLAGHDLSAKHIKKVLISEMGLMAYSVAYIRMVFFANPSLEPGNTAINTTFLCHLGDFKTRSIPAHGHLSSSCIHTIQYTKS
jgi:hypothetical protein